MSQSSNTSVVVVGAGPVGLTMAAELARQGVCCRIVDRNPAPVKESRAVAIHARTLEIFAGMGVHESILNAGHRIHGANIFAADRRILHFSFDELASQFPFAVDLAQCETERLLSEHLLQLGIAVERSTEVTQLEQDAGRVSLQTQTSTFEAEYVVGCDGAQSTIRRLLSIPFPGEAIDEHFVLADAPVKWGDADDEWHLWFHEDGLLTLFPLPGGMYRIIADLAEPASTSAQPDLRAIFEQRGPKDASLGEPTWLSPVHVCQRRVAKYQQGRVFLAGDAAHVHSPAGGQGMNTGIQDAHNLAWKLAMVLRGNAPESLLESYTAEREPVAGSVTTLTENLNSVASLRQPISQKIRNRLIPILAGFEVIEKRLVDRVSELGIHYRSSPIVSQTGRWYAASPLPGERAPHLHLPADHGHTVLLFTGEHPDPEDLRGFANIDRYMRQGYPDEVATHLVTRQDIEWEGSKIMDAGGNIHRAYAAGAPCVYLIRPDRYVGFRSLTSDPLPLLEHLNRVYEPPMVVTEG